MRQQENDPGDSAGHESTGIFFVNIGAGNDTLTLDFVRAFSLDLFGGDGTDRLDPTDDVRRGQPHRIRLGMVQPLATMVGREPAARMIW